VSTQPKEFSQAFFHGTKASLAVGDAVAPGNDSNYAATLRSKFVYFTSNLNVAAWGAELAAGDAAGRIYVVEPSGPFEDDPNVTNRRFPGNPTRSYRSREPLRVIGEVKGWEGHSPDEIRARKESIERLMQAGAQIIED
jgi:rifampin ADP-ribosylating transferase